MSEFFKLNVGEYTNDEMKDLLNLKEPFTMKDIVDSEELLREKLLKDNKVTSEKKQEILSFLAQVRGILIAEAKRDYSLLQPTDLLERGPHMVQRRPERDDEVATRINSLQKPKHTIQQLLCIDSKFRDNYYTSMSTDFLVTLPTVIKNCISMELVALEFPTTYYQISKELGNNFFWLGWTGNAAPNLQFYFISIPDGNYQRHEMQTVINEMIQLATGTAAMPGEAPQCVIDANTLRTVISLGPDDPNRPPPAGTGGARLYLFFNRSRGGMTSTTPGSATSTLPDIDIPSEGGIASNMGWVLGYRMGEYRGSEAYVSEGVYDAWGTKYIYIIVDDFNKNINSSVIPAYNRSLGSDNILARLSTLVSDDFSKGLSLTNNTITNDNSIKKRTYFGPVDVQKMRIRVTDEYGRTIDLNNMDMSFALNLVCVYD